MKKSINEDFLLLPTCSFSTKTNNETGINIGQKLAIKWNINGINSNEQITEIHLKFPA